MTLKLKILAYLLFIFWWVLKKTYRFRYFGLENKKEAQKAHEKGSYALTIWHENIFTATTAFAWEPMAPLASTSKDGDFVTFIFDRIGFSTARGSSTRGGREGLRALLTKVSEGYSPAISVDGPQGPRRKVKLGVVQVAKRGRCAILPVTAVADRMWTLNSWDRFRIPKPFARIAVHIDKPIFVEKDVAGEEFDAIGPMVEQRLNIIEDEALKDLENLQAWKSK